MTLTTISISEWLPEDWPFQLLLALLASGTTFAATVLAVRLTLKHERERERQQQALDTTARERLRLRDAYSQLLATVLVCHSLLTQEAGNDLGILSDAARTAATEYSKSMLSTSGAIISFVEETNGGSILNDLHQLAFYAQSGNPLSESHRSVVVDRLLQVADEIRSHLNLMATDGLR